MLAVVRAGERVVRVGSASSASGRCVIVISLLRLQGSGVRLAARRWPPGAAPFARPARRPDEYALRVPGACARRSLRPSPLAARRRRPHEQRRIDPLSQCSYLYSPSAALPSPTRRPVRLWCPACWPLSGQPRRLSAASAARFLRAL